MSRGPTRLTVSTIVRCAAALERRGSIASARLGASFRAVEAHRRRRDPSPAGLARRAFRGARGKCPRAEPPPLPCGSQSDFRRILRDSPGPVPASGRNCSGSRPCDMPHAGGTWLALSRTRRGREVSRPSIRACHLQRGLVPRLNVILERAEPLRSRAPCIFSPERAERRRRAQRIRGAPAPR